MNLSILPKNCGDCMEDFFGREGILKQRLPNFEFRQQQRDLAEKIENFLLSDLRLLAAEAPTGVGKTYAMLIPALRWAAENNQTVLVLTSGITLQEQLIEKDIPALLDVLGLDLPYGLLKGRGNYACIRKAREIGQEGFLDFNGDQGKASRDISSWLFSTESGDLSELNLGDSHPAKERIASSYLTCLGPFCPYKDHCFYSRMIRAATQWRVVVANYHVYFSHVLGQKKPFPVSFGLLLCDEAHRMEEAARSVTRVDVGEKEWQRLMRRAPRLDKLEPSLLRSVNCTADQFAEEVVLLSHSSNSLFDQLEMKLPEGRSFTKYPPELKNDTLDLLSKCDQVLKRLKDVREASADLFGNSPLKDEGTLSVWADELSTYRDALRWCCGVEAYPNWAYWRDGKSLKSSSVVGNQIIPAAFNLEEGAKMVALSATMTVDNSFEYWSEETGLAPDETVLLDSPFDLASQMEIHVVDLRMNVMAPHYGDVVARVCRQYLKKNGGATLILLSSRKLHKFVADYLKQNAQKDNLEILVQGDLPRSELLKQFKKGERSALVGMASFREGIDVPGDALTQVIIDRIPFPHPGDPVVEARAELEGKENFMKVVLPCAKMQLRQAVGRLVRSSADKGKVVLLDGRAVSRPDWNIMKSLPQVPLKKIHLINPYN